MKAVFCEGCGTWMVEAEVKALLRRVRWNGIGIGLVFAAAAQAVAGLLVGWLR